MHELRLSCIVTPAIQSLGTPLKSASLVAGNARRKEFRIGVSEGIKIMTFTRLTGRPIYKCYVRMLLISPRTAALLVKGLESTRETVVEHPANIVLIDPHSKPLSRH